MENETTGIYADVQRAFPELKLDTTGSRFYSDVIAVCKDIYMGSPPWKRLNVQGSRQRGSAIWRRSTPQRSFATSSPT